MTRSAAVTVRRPGARTTPATRTRTWRQTAEVKKQPKGCIHTASTAGTLVGMAQTSAWVVAPGDQPLRAEVVTMAGADAMRERIAAHPWPQGSRMNLVYAHDRSTICSELPSFAGTSRVSGAVPSLKQLQT